MDKFKEFLISRFGDKICSDLYNNGKLSPENIKNKNSYQQGLVKEHIEKLSLDLDLRLIVNNTNWAFDFPGWKGTFSNISKNNKKKYMIIGLEPHVERYDYQITYGLSDVTPSGKNRFEISNESDFIITCHDDSSLIWTNLFNIIAEDYEKNEIQTNRNENSLIDFLNQFYITDLCHFAPQDKAKAVHKIRNWKKIRRIVAENFLKEEIRIVNPEIIITQGNGVFSELKRILSFKDIKSYPIKFGANRNWHIKYTNVLESGYKVLSLPHFGSNMVFKTFYAKNWENVRAILINQGILE